MKKLALLFLLFSFNAFYSQHMNGYYVTTTNDTIKCKFEYKGSRFITPEDFLSFGQYLHSIQRKVTVTLENGEKLTLKPTDIKLFSFKKRDFEYYKFVSLKEDIKNFYEEVFTGKISVYYSHWSNNAPKKTYYLKDGDLSSRETNFINFRNWIGRLIQDDTELYNKWIDSDNYYQKKEVFDVIKMYNVGYLNKG